MTETFGQRLSRICSERSITQLGLAKMIRASQPAVRRWMRGDFNPQYWELVELAKQLNLSLDYLCGFTDEPRVLYETGGPICDITERLQVCAEIPQIDVWRAAIYNQED